MEKLTFLSTESLASRLGCSNINTGFISREENANKKFPILKTGRDSLPISLFLEQLL
jgi:hypothetical protein